MKKFLNPEKSLAKSFVQKSSSKTILKLRNGIISILWAKMIKTVFAGLLLENTVQQKNLHKQNLKYFSILFYNKNKSLSISF